MKTCRNYDGGTGNSYNELRESRESRFCSSVLQPPPFGNGVLDVTGFLHLVALILVTVMCEGYSVRGRVHRGQHAHLFLILVAVLCEVQRRGTLPLALFRVSAVISVFFPEARVCDRSGVAIVHRTWDFFFGKLALRNNRCTKTVPHLYTLVFRARHSYVCIELLASVSRLENLPCHPSAYGDVNLQEGVRWIWPRSASAFASRIAESVGSPSPIVGRARALSTEGDWASDQTPTARAIGYRQFCRRSASGQASPDRHANTSAERSDGCIRDRLVPHVRCL